MSLPKLPSFDELPAFDGFTGCAWGVWGKDDQLGTINLLTEEVVRNAAQEIKLGKSVSLNWPLNFPAKPMFGRQAAVHESWRKPNGNVHDDSIQMNTQSGSQWDGLKHYGLAKQKLFYNNTPVDDLHQGRLVIPDPNNVDQSAIRLGIHNWAQHGISGRGVLLDLVKFYTASGGTLPYDPWTTHAIPLQDLLDCAKQQGVSFQHGDILLLRIGFTQRYYSASSEERDSLGGKPETLAGIEQTEDMKRFLWDNHFAAIASDQPTVERWPDPEGHPRLHQTLLALWGMPMGEMFDLEALAKVCGEVGRYTFFFTSWPLTVFGGVASPPNAAAYL
ncbi:hypothetical protein EUX98_g4968 [Antrodiella citrinella]|uniref:Cyclase n=1 Tax=Antrodiella citrinella TaxID=2447956 RepID=A0A4S4MSN3_9APHY|nr:hypothetical protein EUX98_g4968 [Antrodiella citrinella]